VSDYEFLLPDVGEGLAEASIVRWLVDEAQAIEEMQPIVEVETAKSVVEIPSPVAGTLVRHGAAEGAGLEVGAVLAVIATAHAAVEGHEPTVASGPARRVAATPTVRKRAVELGIDLASLTGSGPGGRVLMADLSSTTTTSLAAPAAVGDRVEKLSRMRVAIAGSLGAAWAEVPLITDLRDVDAVRLVDARASLADEGTKVSYTAYFAAATVAALRQFSELNASLDLDAGTVTYHGAIHLGVAVSVEGGLTVAVIRDAQTLSLGGLASAIDRLSTKARESRLSHEESTGATFTVSSFGKFGGWYGTPLVVPPQVAIAGFGPIKDRVVPWQGAPSVRATLPLSVSADHRLIDGAMLSQFCSRLEELVSDPIRFLGA
jgi:pyruvate/2-oxoglutarate dehydrogenase complex dihydrolipoamide acyltransferase (E2) component